MSGETLEVVERPTPRPEGDRVLVAVAGAGVNRADLIQRAGRYPAPPGWPPDVPGLEFAGLVAATGSAVTTVVPGDRVFGIAGGGAQASHVVVPEGLCAPVPRPLELVEAGGVPEAFMTAHDAFRQLELRPGERLLVHAVGSGVGTAAVQLARAMGVFTIGTSRTPEKLGRAGSLGLDAGVLAGPDMAERIGKVDAVLDLVGGDYIETDLRVCRSEGRVIVVGVLRGSSTSIDLSLVMRKRIKMIGTTLRGRPAHAKAAAVAMFRHEVVPLFDRGLLHPVLEAVVPLERVDEAYELVASDGTFGKVVLDCSSP